MTSNSALVFGGGACQSTLSNCALNGNLAGLGGGDFQGTLDNCILTGNSATNSGGAAAGSTLDNCTLTGNSADSGGGAADFTRLNNCVAYFNTAAVGANYSSDWNTLNYCCTAPMPANGIGNITNAPLFVDYAGGNLRLQSNSPCINAGDNAYAPDAVDLDDQSRIVSGTVDMGAYEYQGPGSVISYAWLQQFGLPTDGSADAADLDLDGHTTWQEWRCLTDPTNALSALRLVSASRSGTNIVVSWQSVEGVSYFLERATNVAGPPSNFTPLASDIPGQPGTTIYTNTDAAAAQCKPLFYRVGTK